MTLLRVHSSLPEDLEALIRDVIGAMLTVHRAVGSGMGEGVYAAATRIELTERGIPFESERTFPIRYKGHLIGAQRIDLFIDERLVVEIKSVERLHAVHTAQVVSYLRETGARAGLLVNFNVPMLKQGIRRIVL